MSTKSSGGERISVARNPKATHDFHILETMEAGLVLTGTEVKSLRRGKASIKEGYGRLAKGELWLEGITITPYEQGGVWNHPSVRSRKLLLHRRELEKLIGAVELQGAALVPLELYFSPSGKAKVVIGLAKGKKQHDKREDLKKKDAQREIARAMASKGRQ